MFSLRRHLQTQSLGFFFYPMGFFWDNLSWAPASRQKVVRSYCWESCPECALSQVWEVICKREDTVAFVHDRLQEASLKHPSLSCWVTVGKSFVHLLSLTGPSVTLALEQLLVSCSTLPQLSLGTHSSCPTGRSPWCFMPCCPGRARGSGLSSHNIVLNEV